MPAEEENIFEGRGVSVETPRGATVESYYACRNVKIYPIAEHDLDALTTMNTLNTVLLTVGVGLISLAGGIWITDLFTETVTPEGAVLSKFGAWVLVILGVICFAGCWWTWRRRKMMWGRVVKESDTAS
jgi:FtsH-binding integral membrane protein